MHLQQSAKELLGITRDTPICARFADPPHETVGSLSTLLRQPNHLLSLLVQPLQCRKTTTTSSSSDPAHHHHHHHQTAPCGVSSASAVAARVTKDGRDPYCVFRESYCHGSGGMTGSARRSGHKVAPVIREKCDFAEMNRLLSQLAEVSAYLQHTRLQCELIERRCGPAGESGGASRKEANLTTTVSGGCCNGGKRGTRMGHSASSSSYSSDSGKGSVTDPAVLEEEEEGEGEGEELEVRRKEGADRKEEEKGGRDGADCCRRLEEEEAGDREVERLLEIADCLNKKLLHQRQSKGMWRGMCAERNDSL